MSEVSITLPEHAVQTTPAWMRPCQEAEALAAMDKESERDGQEKKTKMLS